MSEASVGHIRPNTKIVIISYLVANLNKQNHEYIKNPWLLSNMFVFTVLGLAA